MIHVDALRREYPADWLLAKRLEREGFRVILTSRNTTHRFLRYVRPDVLILSHPFMVAPEMLRDLAARGVSIFVVEVEGVVRMEMGIESTYPKEIDYASFRRLFVWNEWTRDWLAANRNAAPNAVVVAGSIRNAFLATVADVARNPRRVGFIGRFELVNPFDGRHEFESLLQMSSYHLSRWYVDMESFVVYREIISALLAKGIAVSFRPHPNENVRSYRHLTNHFGSGLAIDSGFDFYEWLESVDVVVGTFSSSFTEPYLLGRPIICIDELLQAKGPETHAEWKSKSLLGAYLPKTVKETVDLATDAHLPPQRAQVLDEFYDEVYALSGAGRAPLDVITETIASDTAGKKTGVLHQWYALAVKLALDLAVIGVSFIKRDGAWSFRNQVQYNYNSVLHHPSSFMRRAWRTLQGGRA